MGAISVENVMGEVMISSPGSRRSRSIASRRDDDPELTMTPWFLDSSSAICVSRVATDSPISKVGLFFMTLRTASISRSLWEAPAGGSFMGLSSTECWT